MISLGLDAGVNPGAVLEISRLEGGGKYLGTITVTDSYPKSAVARFNPKDGKALTRLAPDDLPKPGDRISKATGIR